MKITIYELLGLIKDGKAPKKILFGDTLYEYFEDKRYKDYRYRDEKTDMYGYLSSYIEFNGFDVLNNEVEIIEDKKIGKIEKGDCSPDFFENNTYYLAQYFDDIRDKINEIIDEINKLKEK